MATTLPQLPSVFGETPPPPLKLNLNANYPYYPSESVMNARNKLKTIVLMGIDTHIVYHAHKINKEWGWDLSKKQTVVGVV